MRASTSTNCRTVRAAHPHATWAWLITGALCLPAIAQAQWLPPVPEGCPEMPGDPAAARAVAGERFRAAVADGEAGKWEEALRQFSCSYSIVAHPNTLYNLGMAAERTGELETADHALARCLAEAPDASYRAEAKALLAPVRERLAALPPPTKTPTPPPAETPDTRPDVAGGAQEGAGGTTSAGAVAPPPEGMSTMSIAGWSLLGAGVAAAVAGGMAFAVLSNDEADASLQTTEWSDASVHRDRAETYSSASIALFVVGGAAAIAGTVLRLLDVSEEAPVLPVPSASGESVGLAVVGRF